MTLTYSAHEPSGTVIVWQEGECAEFASVYADLSGSGASFAAKVSRAREIVSAVNRTRAELSERAREYVSQLAPCARCGVLHLEEELYDVECGVACLSCLDEGERG